MRELAVTKSTICSWMRLKYWYVWGAPTTTPVMRTGWMVMLAVGAIIHRLADTARGMPMECPPPRTKETVGFFIPAIISAMASPASMSPPTVLRRIKRPSMSSLSSMVASRGRTCSYLVVFTVSGMVRV